MVVLLDMVVVIVVCRLVSLSVDRVIGVVVYVWLLILWIVVLVLVLVCVIVVCVNIISFVFLVFSCLVRVIGFFIIGVVGFGWI